MSAKNTNTNNKKENKDDDKKDGKKKDSKDANDKDANSNDANSNDADGKNTNIKDANDKKKDKDKNKKPSVPNTLTIYIKTRIPNYTKLLYEPSMTVPTSKSNTVYFDPLVKYINGAIQDIPKEAPPNLKYTQFFEANQFDSLVNRFISKIFNFPKKPLQMLNPLKLSKILNLQRERTLDQAMEEDLINENIKLTLSSLFKRNGIFYINKRPYTIVDRHWKKNSWVIDTKTDNKLINPFSGVSTKDALEEAEKELNEFKKNYATEGSSGAQVSMDDDIINSIIKNTPNIEAKNDQLKSFQDIRGSATFDDENHFIIPNFHIDFTDETDKATEPMTFSLLLDKEVFAKFIEQNKTNNIGKSLITKYERYWKRKEDLYKMRNEYDELYKKIISKKHEYDLKTAFIYNTLSVIIPGTSLTPPEKKTLGEACEDMHDLYVEFIDLLVELANVLYNFYQIQIDYFNYIVDFLKEFKKEYVHIINYYKDTADIANMCIDEDIRIYELLSVESAVTNLNADSQAYFANIKNLKEKLYKLKKEQSILSDINIQETLKKYKDDPYLLILLRKQYNIYYLFFKTSFHTNQYYTWKIYYKGTDALVTKMNNYFFEKMQQTIDFGPTVTEKKLTIPTPTIEFIKNLQDKLKPYIFTGIKENKDVIKSFAQKWFTRPSSEPKPEVQWKLVNDDDLPVIKDSDKELTKDEKNYIEFIKYEVNLFDCITMIINLLHIKCLRQFRLYVAEENETNYDLFILKNKFFYYLALKGFVNILNIPILDFDNIETEFNFYAGHRRNPSISPNFKIPYSSFWDISN